MKAVIDKAALVAALNHAQTIVEKKQLMPILGQVLVEASADGLAITTNNLDMQIVLRIAAEVAAPGAICAPAHGLADVVKRMADGPVGLELVEKKLRVTAGRSKIHLLTLPASDFPLLKAEETAQTVELPAAAIRRLVDRTRFAMHTNDAFANLCGIHLYQADKDHVGATSTDKHRAARQLVPIEGGCGKFPATILPSKLVAQLRRLVDEADGAVKLLIGEKRLIAIDPAGQWELTSKLLEDATFPPIEKAIPAWDVPLTIDAGELADAVLRVSGVLVGKQRTLVWSQAENLLILSARDAEMGDAVEELPCEYAGPERTYGFNPKYVSDQLQSIDGAVSFFSNNPMDPTRIEIAADAKATFLLAQLPVAGGK